MRLLFTCRPTSGHLYPLLPLALAARRAGHAVAFASAPSTVLEARGFGFEAFEAGRERLTDTELRQRFPEVAAFGGRVPREWFFTRWFAGYEAPERAPGLQSIGREWRPDLIVCDWAELAGHAVAASLGIPSATLGLAIPRPDIAELAVPWVEPTWRALGLEVPPAAGLFDHLYLDPCPPSMRPPGVTVPNSQPLRPDSGPPPRESDEPKLARLPPGRVVLVTFGTIFGRSTELYETVIAAVQGLGRTVVVTLGPIVPASAMGSLPANVFCFDFLTQGTVLPRCDLVITHGGSGSTLGPLSHGVPLLVLPQGADQFDNADAVVRAAAGAQLQPADFSEASVRSAAISLLDGSCEAGARRVAAEMAAMPEPQDVLRTLERIATQDRTSTP